jgi:uncharacterized protein YcgI (DUF1989 family)
MHFLLAYIGMRRQIDTLIQLSNCDDDNDDDEYGDVHYCYLSIHTSMTFSLIMHVQ